MRPEINFDMSLFWQLVLLRQVPAKSLTSERIHLGPIAKVLCEPYELTGKWLDRLRNPPASYHISLCHVPCIEIGRLKPWFYVFVLKHVLPVTKVPSGLRVRCDGFQCRVGLALHAMTT